MGQRINDVHLVGEVGVMMAEHAEKHLPKERIVVPQDLPRAAIHHETVKRHAANCV